MKKLNQIYIVRPERFRNRLYDVIPAGQKNALALFTGTIEEVYAWISLTEKGFIIK